MRMFKKVLITIVLLLILFGGVSYVDYFLVKTKDRLPRIALKKENKEKEMTVYSALFYKVWECNADNSKIIGDHSDPDPVCPHEYVYENDYYTNSTGLKISKKNIEAMTYKNIYEFEVIDVMSTESEVDNAVYVSTEYAKTVAKTVNEEKRKVEGESKDYNIVVFPTFKKENDRYTWVYDFENESEYYCTTLDTKNKEYSYSKVENGYCNKEFNPIKMEKKWCELYVNSSLYYSKELTDNLCK